jgi:hypothetical protein
VNAWKVILSTLVIFIAGVITGGLLVTNALKVRQSRPKPPNSANGPNGPNAQAANPWLAKNRELLRRMDRELDLTPEQHTHIEAIIATSQERTKALWKPIAPQMNKETQLVHSEIRDLLDPDQKKKFDGFKVRVGPEKHRNATNSLLSGTTNSVTTNFPSVNGLPANP